MERWIKVSLLTAWAVVLVCLIGCGGYDSPANVEQSAGQGFGRLGSDPQAMPADGLVAYWPFDGNASDETGNGNDGIVHGATLAEDRCGRPNSAYGFDGLDDCIDVPDSRGLDFGAGDFTVCCWVYMNHLPDDDCCVLGKMAASTTGNGHGDSWGYGLIVRADGRAFANVQQGGVGAIAQWDTPLATGEWYFIVGVRNAGALELFVDGVPRAATVNTYNGDNETSLQIGAETAVGDERWLNGSMDEVRMYNRALTEDEIAALIVPCWTSVIVDIRPGSDVNPVNPGSRGVIAVAVLTTSTAAGERMDFDATTVDPLSVRFGPGSAAEAHGTGHLEDIDGDGDIDLVLHFRTQDTGIVCGDTECSLTGETLSGEMIRGTDSIITVGCE